MTRHFKLIDPDLASKLTKKKAVSFTRRSLALDENNDINYTAQLLFLFIFLFIRGINGNFEKTDEFLVMESLKEKSVLGVIKRHKPPFDYL